MTWKGADQADSWYRRRGYTHFDRRVPLAFARRYVQNPATVARHSFLPFISYVKTTPRYRPRERRVEVKRRAISYASHLDSHIYSWYSHELSEALEKVLLREECGASVIAYRALGKCNIEYASEVFDHVEERGACVVKAFDVSGFFDNIDHQLLKESWCRLLGGDRLPEDHYKVYKSITAYSCVQQSALYKELGISGEAVSAGLDRLCTPEEFRTRVRAKGLIHRNDNGVGIPQGSPISALLSNIYLLDFDRQMSTIARRIGGIYRRYSDDILWICPAGVAGEIESEVHRCIGEFRLKINPTKIETSVFGYESGGRLVSDKPLQYLGFVFDGQRRLVRPNTLARFYRRIRTAIRHAKRMAAKTGTDPRVFRRRIYERFSHLGTRNFVTYGRRAAITMDSDWMRRQVGRHWRKLHEWLPDDH